MSTKTVGHTSGEWKALAGPCAYIRIVAEGHENTIARLYRDDMPDWRENEANARLIAASPAMYEALKMLIPNEHAKDADILLNAKYVNWDFVRAAIARVEGKV